MRGRTFFPELDMHLVVIGGSDAGISAALRAQELEPAAEITVLVADDYSAYAAYPIFSAAKLRTGVP
jgi:NADPH-dependent 2,4-dienoyl-CoA reductase/sulfur reductase-like enzyme